MNLFHSLSDSLLHERTASASVNEKAATLILLEHLVEVDRRRLYAARGYSGLWEYVHKALGYSEAQASDRVNAMRAMVKIPEVKAGLESKELTLTSAAKLGTHLRRERLGPSEALSLLDQIKGKPSREVERILVSHSSEPPRPERVRAVTSELTRITLDVDSEFLAQVRRMKELKGNLGLSFQEVFRLAMGEYIQKREPKSSQKSDRVSNISTRAPACKTAPVRSRYISVRARNEIRLRSTGRCEYIDSESGRRCESGAGLQLDHIRPFAKGGSNEAANLRNYCPAHNRFAAIKEYGEAKMGKYFDRSRGE